MEQIVLREFKQTDLELFKKWLQKPYILKWYRDPKAWVNEIINQQTKYFFIKHFIVEANGKPIGFCQFYDYQEDEKTWDDDTSINDIYSIDYLIGEEEYLGKKLGREIVYKLTHKIFRETEAKRIIVKPDGDNVASRKTLLSAGYEYDKSKDYFEIKRNRFGKQ